MEKPFFIFYSYIVAEETHPDGTVIVKENSYSNWMYIILEGRAKVKKKTPKGEILIDYLEGSVFGKTGLVFSNFDAQRTTSLIADGPVTLGVLDIKKLDNDWIALSSSLRSLLTCLIKKRQEALSTVISMSEDLYSKIKDVKSTDLSAKKPGRNSINKTFGVHIIFSKSF